MPRKQDYADVSAAKRAAVVGKKPSSTRWIVLGAIALLLSAGGWFALRPSAVAPSPVVPAAATAPTTDGDIRHAVAGFEDGKARYFSHNMADGTVVRYFLLRDAAGTVRSAFDACDSCWPHGKGYGQEGGEMICGNCGMRFPADKIGEVKGGCNPAPLASRVEKGEAVVRVADIEAGRGYFDLPKGG
jgi:uncharacterized membrane protein